MPLEIQDIGPTPDIVAFDTYHSGDSTRPGSFAVAELVDNSLSAGATHVHLEYDADERVFSVLDDGKGMRIAELQAGMRIYNGQERRGIDNCPGRNIDAEARCLDGKIGFQGNGGKRAAFTIGAERCTYL